MKQATGFICGLLVGTMGVTTVMAAGGIKSAEFNLNKVIFNGTELNLEGQQMVSVVKDGEDNFSNYMPVRGVLEAMGYVVDWNAAENAVVVTAPEATQDQIEMVDLGEIRTNLKTDADGIEHAVGISFVIGINNSDPAKGAEFTVAFKDNLKLAQDIVLSVVNEKTYQEMRTDMESGTALVEAEVLAALQKEFNSDLILTADVYNVMIQ